MNDGFVKASGSATVEESISRGEDAVSRQEWDEARGWFERALQLDPKSWKAVQGLGVVNFWQGRREEAWDRMVEALRMAPHDADNADNLLDIARSLGREEEAKRLLSDLSDAKTSPAEPICEKGEALLGSELWPEATRTFLEAVDLDGERSRAWSGLGIACFRSGLRNAGRIFFEMALRLDPSDEDAVLNWSESCGLSAEDARNVLQSAGVAPELLGKAMEARA